MKKVVVNKKASKSLKEFFPWVYKSDILHSEIKTDVDIANIVDEDGNFLAIGYVNFNSVITIRVLSFKNEKIDYEFFKEKILNAIDNRIDIESNAFRVIHSEADGLPGLIVDKYEDFLVIWINTLGMMRFKDTILDILFDTLTPKGVIIDADRYSLEKEGIKDFQKKVIGDIPKEIVFEENGVKFLTDLIKGQKTGFYLDQRRNRDIVIEQIKQKSNILDLFCNVGGFGLYGAVKKRADVTLVDISKDAIELAKKNFKLNGVEGEFVCENVFDFLRVLRKEKRKFDLIIIDPPSFAKSKNQKKSALRGFKDLMVNSMKLIEEGGYIAIFSCSYFIGFEDLKDVTLKASKDNKKRVEIVRYLTQDIDHPIILNMPYSEYLRGVLFKIF